MKIVPNLWFDNRAEEAADFYVSVFKNSKILGKTIYGAAGARVSGMKAGSIMTVSFKIEGQEFLALNGGPQFKFSEAVSFIVNCKDQKEIDYYWNALSADPAAEVCGWLKDKFGLSWQVVPQGMEEFLSGKDPEKSEKAMDAFLKMKKIDINLLKRAYNE